MVRRDPDSLLGLGEEVATACQRFRPGLFGRESHCFSGGVKTGHLGGSFAARSRTIPLPWQTSAPTLSSIVTPAPPVSSAPKAAVGGTVSALQTV
jgi:hypothetical protein